MGLLLNQERRAQHNLMQRSRIAWRASGLAIIVVALLKIYQSLNSKISSESTSTNTLNPSAPTVDECRNVFRAKGQGGVGELTKENIIEICKNTPTNIVLDVCQDLQDFTGLADDEFYERMTRQGRFHFEGEHQFWNPASKTELAWYYTSSIDYLFANAIHGVPLKVTNLFVDKEYEPVLDYSAGVGTNVLYLAKKGIQVQYFGIGMAEYNFAHYRVWKADLEDLVEFKRPFSAETGYKFDPINGPLPRDGSLGSIIAMDVLEHIPEYRLVVDAMVMSLRVGGIILERSPFAQDDIMRENVDSEGEEDDLRVHLSNGGISMEEAMGPKMMRNGQGVWKKISM